MDPLTLSVEGLACERGGRRVFADVGFQVAPGGGLIVTGPNGSGKSSLLRLIAGLLAPAAGRICLTGHRAPPDDAPAPGEMIHYVGHKDGVKPQLTVSETLAHWAVLLGGTPSQIEEGLGRFGLERLKDLPGAYLSAGQKKRVALARLILGHRPLWLLDEPTTALDVQAQGALEAVLSAHLAAGGLALVATHAPLHLKDVQRFDMSAHGAVVSHGNEGRE